MPDHHGIPAGAINAANTSMHVLMDQAITDNMFSHLLEGVIIWEDSEDLVPVDNEAQSFDDLTPSYDHGQDGGGHDAAENHLHDAAPDAGE